MKLYDHQTKILNESPTKHLLCWGTGTGKTITSIMLANKNCKSFLVICPKGLKENWKRNLEKHAIKRFTLCTKEEFRKDWRMLGHYEGVIVDEAHYFFGISSLMSKALVGYFTNHYTVFRWLLTATPFLSTPWNIFMALKILDQNPDYIAFRRMFFAEVKIGRRPVFLPRANKKTELVELIKRIGTTVRLEDCIDMPEQIDTVEYFGLTGEQIKAISSIKEINHIVKWTLTHQICGGTKKGNEYEPTATYASEKLERLIELAIEHPRMIVVCRYRCEMDYVAKVLNEEYKVFMIHGGVDGAKRQEIIDTLTHQHNKYVLIVNASCSEGWELPTCDVMIFYSKDFSLKNNIQMKGRLTRINNPKKNLYISLVVKDSIDEDVYETIEKKEDFHVSIYAESKNN